MALYSFQRIPSPPQSPNSQLSPASRELRLMFLEGDELRNQWAEQASTLDTERSAAIRREAKLKDILRTSDAHGNLSLLAIAQVPANELHAIPHASDEELGLKVAWPDAFEHAQTIDALSLVTPALDAPSSTLTKATTQVVRQQVAASSMVPLSAAGDDMTVRSTTATRVDASSTKPIPALSATRFEARDTNSPPIESTTAHSARSVRQSSPAATARMAVTVPQPKADVRVKSEHRSPPLPAKTIVELARRPPPTTERAGSLGIHLVERVSQAETGALPSPPQQDATQMVNQPHNSANAPSSRVSTQQPPSVFMQMPSASSPPPRHSPVGERNQPHADVADLSIGVMQASDSSLTPIVSLALQGAGPLTRAGQSNRQPQMPSTFVTSNGKKYVVVPVTSGGNSNNYDSSGPYPSATHKFAAHEHGEFAYAAPTPDFAADQLAAGPIASTGSGSSVFPQLPPRTSGPSPALLAMAGGRPETAFMPPTTGSDSFKSRKKKKRAADRGKAIGNGVPIASNSNNGAGDEDRALILLSEPLKPFVPHTIHDLAAVNVPLPPRPGTSLPSGPKVWIRELTPEHTTGQAFVPQLFQDHARRANANANASWLASSNEDMRSVSDLSPRRQQSYERSFDTYAHAKPPTSDSVLASASSSAPTAREPQEIQSETKPPPKQVAEPQGAPISRPDLKSRAGSQVPGSCRGRSSVVRDAPPMVNGIPMHSLPKNAESARAASVEAASRASSLEPSLRADRKRSRSRSTSVVRTSIQPTASQPNANPFTDDELPKKRPRLSPVAEDEPMETGADPRLAKASATIAADSKQGDQSVLPEISGDDDEEERIVYDVRGFAPLGASRHNVSSEFSAPNGQHRQHSVEEIAPSPAERLHTRMAIPLEDRISDGPITIMPSSSRSRSRATSPAVRRSPVSQGPRKLPLDQRITSPDAPHLSPRARSPQQHTSQSFSRGRSPSPRSAWPPRDRPRSRSPRRRQWSSRSRSRSRDSFYSPGQRRGSSWDRGRRSSMSRENNYRPSYNSRSRSRSRSPVRRAASPYRRPYSSRSRSRGWSPPLRRGEYGRERSRSRSMSRSRTADYRPQPPRARGRGRGRGRGGPLRGR